MAELAIAQVGEAILVRGPQDLLALGFSEAVREEPGDGRTVDEVGRGELRNGRPQGLVLGTTR